MQNATLPVDLATINWQQAMVGARERIWSAGGAKVQHVAPRGNYGTVSTLLCTKKASGTTKLCNFCNQERRGEAETARFLSRVTELAFDSDSYSEEDWARMKAKGSRAP